MNIDRNTIIMVLGFFGLTSWTAWKDFHNSYIDKKIQEKEQKKLITELVEGDLLNEQKKFNRLVLKKIDSLKGYNLDQDSHIYELEKFNSHWGYRY